MTDYIPVTNATMELKDCADRWTLDEKHGCWCLEDVLYTPKARVPKFQRLSIFVPRDLRNADGSFSPRAARVPVVFENNSAGYMQMPHVWLDGPRCYARQYLDHGLIYVTCGCRGRESRDKEGRAAGKGPASLVDLKTALRFLRHNRDCLPGDWDKVISVGWSAGGAMSTLLAVTGDNANYAPYLEENGAFLEESDRVFAAQIYCPIVDLEHADLAYEWMFRADRTCEDSPAGPAETMTAFKEALSGRLSRVYVDYFNSLDLRHPETGEPLLLGQDGRSGSGYDYLMGVLEASAEKFLTRAEQGLEPFTPEQYLKGEYMARVPAPKPPKPGRDPGMHHAGPGMALGRPPEGDHPPMSLGDLMSRPPKGMEVPVFKPPMMEVPGKNKEGWLSWDGTRAHITSLDDYVLCHRRRMKPCTSFDKLTCDSGENQAFGTQEQDYVHFSTHIAPAILELKEEFPEEFECWYHGYAAVEKDGQLARRVWLLNPMNFIGTDEKSARAAHYRIRVGASDADTSLSVSMVLAVKLANAGAGSVDYALVWDQPHSEADYPGEVCAWIDAICGDQAKS